MKPYIYGWLFVLFFPALVICQSSTSPPEKDFQIWNDTQFTLPLKIEKDTNNKDFDRLTFILTGTFRLGRNLTRPVDERFSSSLDYKLNNYFRITPSYVYIATQPYLGRRNYENRLNLAVTYEHKLPIKIKDKNLILKDRNLIERRFRNSQSDSTRYRNRLTFEFPFSIKSKETIKDFSVFIADEIFYDWSVKDWSRNRFTAGISHKFIKTLTGELYYLRQNDGRARPGDLHVIGTTVKFRFNAFKVKS